MDDAVQGWLADPGAPKVMHDAKGPLLALYAAGWGFGGLVMDTALAAYLLLPGQRSFDLRDLCALRPHRPRPRGGRWRPAHHRRSGRGGERQLSAAAETAAMLTLAEVLEGSWPSATRCRCCVTMELPTLILLAQMERAGIAVDAPLPGVAGAAVRGEVRKAEEAAWEIAGRTFNLGSPKQLQELLFGERGLPKTKKIKTGYTTDAGGAGDAVPADAGPAARDDPALSGRLEATADGRGPAAAGRRPQPHPHHVQPDGGCHRPPVEHRPQPPEHPDPYRGGRQIRAGFVVGEGYQTLLTADYSQIEMRIAAHLSGDDGLIEAFRSGEDLHTTVGSRVFGVPADEVDPEMRRRVKAMSHGLAYGLSAFGLSQQLQISRAEAQGLMDEYFLRFGGVRDYLAEAVEAGAPYGLDRDAHGAAALSARPQQRQPPAPRDGRADGPERADPGSAADLVKVAMLNVRVALARQQLHSGCCCRCMTSWCWKWRPARSTP